MGHPVTILMEKKISKYLKVSKSRSTFFILGLIDSNLFGSLTFNEEDKLNFKLVHLCMEISAAVLARLIRLFITRKVS